MRPDRRFNRGRTETMVAMTHMSCNPLLFLLFESDFIQPTIRIENQNRRRLRKIDRI
jgi:hypothetical protein